VLLQPSTIRILPKLPVCGVVVTVDGVVVAVVVESVDIEINKISYLPQKLHCYEE